jgi:hypothetical protein
MPVNILLDINYTPVQKTAIETALDTAKTEVENVIGVPLNLSDEERGDTPSVDEQRESYVNDAVTNLAPLHPTLLGPEITAARAKKLWEYRNSNNAFIARLLGLVDLLTDANINAENICLKFTEDFRDNAQRFKDRNVPGADVVWDRLKGLHTVEANPPVPVP